MVVVVVVRGRGRHALQGEEIVAQGVYEVAGAVLLEQLDGQQLAHVSAGGGGAGVSRVAAVLAGELQAVGQEGVQGGGREVLGADLLLHGPD